MTASEPLIRPPLQRRSQESLERLLRAGLDVVQEQGVDGLTLQEVSRRAGVSIGSIYARVPSREALIMAIYEYAMGWTEEERRRQLQRARSLDGLSPRERIQRIVVLEANALLAHADTLRVFMRAAPSNPTIWQRGAEKSQIDADAFRTAILTHRDDVRHPDPELAIDVAWRMVYCTLVRRITHGPRFESERPVSDAKLVRELARAAADYLV